MANFFSHPAMVYRYALESYLAWHLPTERAKSGNGSRFFPLDELFSVYCDEQWIVHE